MDVIKKFQREKKFKRKDLDGIVKKGICSSSKTCRDRYYNKIGFQFLFMILLRYCMTDLLEEKINRIK